MSYCPQVSAMSRRSLSTNSGSSRDLAFSVAESGSRASSGHSELVTSPKLPPVLRCDPGIMCES